MPKHTKVESNQGQRNWKNGDDMVERFQNHDTEIRGHVAYWSVQSHVPNWFKDMEGKVPIAEMEVIALDWLDDLINRYDGKIFNWDVFNEVLHGNFFRRNFGKDFWNKIIRRIRNINSNVDLAFNDYEILSSNFAKCYITYLDDVEIDFFGLQAGPKESCKQQLETVTRSYFGPDKESYEAGNKW